MDSTSGNAPRADELVPLRALQSRLARIFPTQGSMDWEVRNHRREYIAGGALFEIGGRLLAHPPTFERIALELGSKKLAARHSVSPPPV